MKHPVLHVKKGVPVYDDSLEDREPPRRAVEPVSRFRTGKRRRRGGLTFLPLLILAFALVFVFRFIPGKPSNHAVLAGWEIVLRASPYEGAVPVGVTFTRSDGSPVPKPPPVALVGFFCPETGEKQELTETLSRAPYTIHASMKNEADVRTVKAEVIIGSQRKTLTIRRTR